VIVEHSFFLPITPKATQRSRCTCRGRFAQVYTDPKYKEWREEALPLLHSIASTEDFRAVAERPVRVDVEVIVRRPKTTKRGYPRGDRDNYEKGLFDVITASGHWWRDDDQIVDGDFSKRWANEDEPEGYAVKVTFL
jgi:Holliday junction resolvase RusA-like endonuclease